MTSNDKIAIATLGAIFALAGCSPKADHSAATGSQASASILAPETATDTTVSSAAGPTASLEAAGYTGKWTGPEGTSLTIKPAGGEYQVVIQNLDGPRTFSGTLKADGIHITRDSASLIIHKGDGRATGMKWLADKTDCLVVDANEGYCKA